jgi:acetolactate synthase-1/2/3 large subunit
VARTGAELIVDTLVARGVGRLYSVSGNHILSLYDATIGRDIAIVHTRHEAAAVHMADGWGRLTGEPGVALVTAGPGHLNAVSALYGALMSESPVVLLSGHAPRSQIGAGGFQEVDQVTAARPVTKAAWLAEDPERLGDDIDRALAIARSGRPGPVHVSVPGDVLEARVSASVAPKAPAIAEPAMLQPAVAAEIVALLAGAERPLMLAGPAMSRGRDWAAVARFGELIGAPAFPAESPRGVNDPWLRAAAPLLGAADVVLLVGKRLDFSLKFGRTPAFAAKCRFVAIDAEDVTPSARLERTVVADPAAAIATLTNLARGRAWDRTSWWKDVTAARAAMPPAWDAHRRSARAPMHPLRVCAAVQPYLDAGAVLVSDGGEFGQWAQAGLDARERLINGPAGSIGSAIPMAIAARLARPGQHVFVTVGDGTFGFHGFELDTAVRLDAPIIVIVGNDARWNAEHQLQLQQYGVARAVGCELRTSRYERVAEGLGAHGEFVDRPDDLSAALARAVAAGRPACVNVVIDGVAAPTFSVA